jgi:hypothetical protein
MSQYALSTTCARAGAKLRRVRDLHSRATSQQHDFLAHAVAIVVLPVPAVGQD